MNRKNDLTRLANDLAAHWADPVLEILNAVGISYFSIDMELETWRVVKKVLRQELGWQPAVRSSSLVSLSTLMERVLHRSAEQLAIRLGLHAPSDVFKTLVRRLAGERGVSSAERSLFLQLIDQPMLHGAFKRSNPADFTPRLRVSAV